jgi:FtsZ-interacting cell division protein ZipA
MSTVLIVVIVVVVVAVIALLLLLPRLRERERIRSQERELGQRREQVVEAHRDEASGRERRAEVAEQRARVAAQEAERERAEAHVHDERAALYEKGLADHELIGENEREKFAGTSAVEGETGEDASGDTAGENPDTHRTSTSTAGGQVHREEDLR